MPGQIGRSIPSFHRLIAIPWSELARKFVAMALIILMPAQTLPAEARSQGAKNQNTFQKSAPQVLLPPGGLDSLLKALHASDAGASRVAAGAPGVFSSARLPKKALAVSRTVLTPAGALPALAAAKSMPAQLAPLPPSASSNGIVVSVGYADNLSPSINFPSPWQGASNVSFYGAGPNFNAGAIRLDNTTSTDIVLDSVTVDMQRPGPTFSLWQNVTIPANGSAILTQTSPYNFNTSGYSIVSCGGTVPAGDTRVPKITLTIGGTATDFLDTAHVLDTGGFDLSCRGNRSLAWRPVGTTGIESPSAQITLGPDGSISATGTTSTFAAQANDAAGQPLANASVSLTGVSGPNSSLSVASVSNAQGAASFRYSSSVAGSDLLQANLPNLTGSAVLSNRVTANWTSMGACPAPANPSPNSTSLIYLGQTSVHVGDTIHAAAVLQDGSGNAIPGRTLTLTFEGQIVAATTDGTGVASTAFKADATGSQIIAVSFAGAAMYQPSSTSGAVSISRENTFLTYTGPTLVGTGVPIQLTAQLRDLHHNAPLANETLTFQLGTVQAKAITDSTGTATASLTLTASEANGPAQIQVSFAGDANYNPSFVSNPAVVYQTSSFVIWGGNPTGLHLGQDVNFWGAQWAKQVTGGNYAANASFKGFAQTVTAMQLCLPQAGKGQSGLDDRCWMWSSKPGQSFPPATLPTYIEAIVSTAIAKQGSEIFGNIASLVVLKVDTTPVYGPDPSQPGFGTIVAVIADGAAVFPPPVTLSASQSQAAKVLPGQTYVVNAVVTNSSQQPAINVAVGETFDGTTPVSGSQTDSSLSPSSQFTALFSETAPSFPGRQPGETSSAYESRLASVDGRFFTSSGAVTFTDAAGQPYLPIEASSFSQLELPRLTVSLNGPVCVNPGQKISYTVKVTNLGSAPAAAATAVVTLPDGSNSTVPISNLGPGMSFASTLNYQVPALAPKGSTESTADYLARLAVVDGKSLAASAQVNWQDAQGNSYGAVDAQFSSTQQHVPIVSESVASLPTLLPATTATLQFNLKNSGGGNAIETDLSTNNPDGTTSKAAPFSLAAGQSATATTTWKVPVPAVRMSAETNAAYQARLAALDGNPLNFAISVGWTDAGGSHYGPTSDNALTTEILPNLTLSFTGPAIANAGDAISYGVSLQNLGHAPAPVASLVVTLPDGTTATPSVPSGGLAAGATFTTSVPFKTGSTISGNISAAASLRWQDANGNTYGPQTGSLTTQVTNPKPKQPPVVTVGPDQTIALPTNSVTLTGSATDDGLPVGSTLTYLWTKDAGPGSVTFGSSTSPTTTATFSGTGIYVLRLSVSDSQLTGSNALRVTVLPQHLPPTVNAGNGQLIRLPRNSVVLNGSVTGNGLPPGAVVTSSWSFVSGPGAVVFVNANSPVTTATFTTAGTYGLRLTANDGTFSSSADVAISVNSASFPQALVLSPSVAGPDVTEASQTLTTLLTDLNGAPVTNAVVQFTVSGPNATTGTAATAANGVATFSYTGFLSGVDSVVATTLVGGLQLVSNSTTVNWVRPLQPISSTPIMGMFFRSLCAGYFCTPPTQQPDFTQNFPTINFDPPPGTLPGNNSGVDYLTRPFTDVITDLNGNVSGTIVAQGNGEQAGVGTLFEFQAVFTGTLLVRVPGNYTIRIYNDDGMFFGIGNGATRVSGPMLYNVPASGLTPFNNYPIMGSYNTGTGPVGFDYVVNFPSPGSYPFEVDYAEGFGQGLSLTMALVQGTAVTGVSPATSIALTPNTPQTPNIGNKITLTALVQDASGAVLPYKPVVFYIKGANTGQIQATTDVNGRATLSYTSLVGGSDRVQATAPIIGITGYSNEVNLTWNVVGNQPPVITMGPNQTIHLPHAATLSAVVTDDGLPNGTLTMTWTQTSGPAAANILSPMQPVTQVTFPQTGTYVFTLTASDSALTSSASVTVTVLAQVNEPPVVNAGSAQTIQLPQNTVTLNGSATDDGLPNGTLIIAWSMVSGPGTVTFGSPSTAVTQATFSAAGTYILQLSANDSALTTTSSVTITVLPAVGPPPTVNLSIPDGQEITQPTPVTGNVSGGSWKLAYSLVDDFNPQPFIQFATGSGAVNGGTLGTLDPSLLLNGTYQIQLTTTTADLQFATTTSTVSVTRNMKVGVFTLSFNDLTVPMAGLPIQIVRTYDSRDKGQGDFGTGWRLSLSNARLQKNHNLGLAWQETITWSGYFPQYCLQPSVNKIVTITLPDGKVYRFQAGSTPQCQSIGPITAPTVTFTQLPGAAGTNGAKLVAADGGAAVVDGPVPGSLNLVGYDGNIYNPTVFNLTTAQGYVYVIDQKLGITRLTDPNGNTLTFTASGIVHSSGKSVTFVRDPQSRIARITDPNGNALVYAYNSNGDLAGFDDRTNNQTTYAYGANHYLLSITSPNGQKVLTNTYDANGRLTATADAFNNSVGFAHDIPNRRETMTDRRGNSTVYNYDADGNVIQVTDPLGNVTTSTYDADDNKLTETNALGKTSSYTYDTLDDRLTETDPLGHKTSYTYNQFQKVLSVTDPLNHATSNTYDGNGNLLTTTDPLGKTTTNTYSSSGLLLTTKDPLGNTTSFGYDGSGNLTQQTDALNTVTSYIYDANGNRRSQSVIRTLSDGVTKQTLTTAYVYDANNRLAKTTAPDGSATQVVYNTLGQQGSTIDALGHSTSYTYDADGRLTQTTYPDTTTDVAVYDAEGHRTQSISRGIVTNYVYDKVGRLTQTIAAADNATTATAYDAIGQVLSTTDPLNHVTSYTYDDAGRRTSVSDALNHVTTFAYDNAGNQLSVKDANSNTTQYVYDAANRRTKITYPDSKFETTGYDALGRVTARTDANGKTTQYGYDNLGRLTSVTDALGQVTKYAYDEVGNRLTQTDANVHTTSYAYDQRGRRIQRKLPLGQTESYTYDAAGNLATRTDFNGKTTKYAYDVMNRLASKTPDPSFSAPVVWFSYTATGKRKTMNDASGQTTYQYDARDRLISKVTPEGRADVDAYDLASSVKQLTVRFHSSFAVYYGYDALNRLSGVYNGDTNSTASTGYGYDAVGNLQNVTYPNGMAHSYTYDNRNRLTNLGVAKGTAQLAGYSYLLDASGHRLSVSELSGRTVNYGYDNLYRLTSETIASDPNAVNGAVNYTYDAVGNRTQKVSTLPGYPGGLSNYNANDQLSTDTYDNDGNTTASSGVGYVYDFENHLIQAGAGITMVYDGDGNRVSKTVGGITTTYLVDDTMNPTGNAQVLQEVTSTAAGSSAFDYVYGLERINERHEPAVQGQAQQVSWYVYDGHGSVRALTDQTGAVTDTYDYDAFGNLVHSTGTTPNVYLYSGERFDPDLGLYLNRARYLNTSTGRFWTMDTSEGDDESPLSLHKYLYVVADPTDLADPSGLADTQDTIYGKDVHRIIGADFVAATGGIGLSNRTIDTILFPQRVPVFGRWRPDLVNPVTAEVYEIKPATDVIEGLGQLTAYIAVLRTFDLAKREWGYGWSYTPRQNPIQLAGGVYAVILPAINGVIPYKVVNLRLLVAEAIVGTVAAITITVTNAILVETLAPGAA